MGSTLVLDYGNGWQSRLAGLSGLIVGVGDELRCCAPLGALSQAGALDFAVLLDGHSLDPWRCLMGTTDRPTGG